MFLVQHRYRYRRWAEVGMFSNVISWRTSSCRLTSGVRGCNNVKMHGACCLRRSVHSTLPKLLRKKAYGMKLPSSHCHRNRSPLKPKQIILPAAFDAASELGRNALKKLSKHWVFASYKKLKESDLWTSHGTGLASFDGALSLDLIDLRATEDEIFETWQEFASSKRLNTNWVPDADCEIHHRTCWASYGCCVRSINKALTNKLVHGLAGHLSEGAWLK